jgi:nitrate/TMAO reductase-like tetraheme cytochrome c subunit
MGEITETLRAVKRFWRELWRSIGGAVKQHRRGLWGLVAIVSGIVVILVVTTYKFTETTTFCGLCHDMKPYIESWKTSSHSEVVCIECHYEPGFVNHLKGKWRDGQLSLAYFITGKKPSKPHAVIGDKSCLQAGCHQKEDLKNSILFKNVVFNHALHTEELRRGKKLRCTTCHAQLVQGAHLTVTETDCFICHFYGKKDVQTLENCLTCAVGTCTSCHSEPKWDIDIEGYAFNHRRYIEKGVSCGECHLNVIQGDGGVPPNRCLECHNEPEILQTKYSSEFIHKNHVTDYKLECYRCHSEIKHFKGEIPTLTHFSSNCDKCHAQEVHLGPREMYRGVGGLGVPPSPSKMYLAKLDCTACHSAMEEGEKALYTVDYDQSALEERCIKCHGTGYERMLQNWQKLLTTAQSETNNAIYMVQSALYGLNEEGIDRTTLKKSQNLLNEARRNYSFVLLGKGAHNIEYALKILNVSINRAEKAMALISEDYAATPRQSTLSCTTLCHVGMDKQRVRFNGIGFSHETHVISNEVPCEACHSGRKHHGQTYLRNCSECHHGASLGGVKCENCHDAASDLFYGKGGVGVSDMPGIKVGVIECADCHWATAQGKRSKTENIRASCVSCHEETYAQILDGWMSTGNALISHTASKVEEARRIMERKTRKGKKIYVSYKNIFEEAEHNLKLVKDGKAVHNVDYSEALLTRAEEKSDELIKLLEQEK